MNISNLNETVNNLTNVINSNHSNNSHLLKTHHTMIMTQQNLPSLSNFLKMAEMQHYSINPNNGYCSATKTYHSLHESFPLPPETTPLSITEYVLTLLHSNPNFSPSSPVFIDSSTHTSLSYADFLRRIDSLCSSLSHRLSASDTALILSPTSFHVPVLYFSLLSLGVVTSAANPLSTPSELLHCIHLIKPTVIFAVSSAASKLTSSNNDVPIILIDSPQFDAMLARGGVAPPRARVSQLNTGVILFSSGTTGRVKGVELSHRNFISIIAVFHQRRLQKVPIQGEKSPAVSLLVLPLFHVFGFLRMIVAVSMADTLVLMERFDFVKLLETVERHKVTDIPVSPPLLVTFEKSELTNKYDLSSLECVSCGGAPLSKEVAQRFKARFPYVQLIQGYALTEAVGVAGTDGPDECERFGYVGRLLEHMQAKIVDPSTGDALPPGRQGELWLGGPTIMKEKVVSVGYVGDKEATAATFHPDGWLKTGDLCYFDSQGFLYIVDRLKELIKYKGYQVPPAELERILLSHPEIADAAVIPYPDEEAGEIPMAFVVRRPESSITTSQVMDYVAKEVSPYKRIRRVAFIDAIPKNPSGKILRRELVKQATASPSKL